MYDRRTGQSFTQICVGNIADATKPCPWSTNNGEIGDRIEYTHHPTVGASLDIDHGNTRTFHAENGPGSGTGADGRGRGAEDSKDKVSVGWSTSPDGVTFSPNEQSEPFRTDLEDSRDEQTIRLSSTDRCKLESLAFFDSNPSYGLVTVLSEPLESRIEARLVQPRGAPNGSHMGAFRESGTNPNVRRGSLEAKTLGEREPPTSDTHAESNSAGLGHSPANSSTGSAGNQRHVELNYSLHPVKASALGNSNGGQHETSPIGQSSGSSPQNVKAIIGPIIGRAEIVRQSGGIRESCRVAVVLEVDGDTVVTCVVSLSAEMELGEGCLGFASGSTVSA